MAKKKKIELLLIKGDKCTDISQLVEKIKWGGRKGSSARRIEVSLLDDSKRKDARVNIDVEEGYHCIFNYNGDELFRGIAMTQGGKQNTLTLKAYDNGIYLANNRDTFVYSDKTTTEIFKDVCNRYGLPYSDVAQTTFKVPELNRAKTTAFDALCDAMSQDYHATKVRHYIDSKKGKLRLLTRRENVLQWVIEADQNLISHNYSKSIEKVKTRIALLSKEDTVVIERKNSALEAKIGIMKDIDRADDTLNSAQLSALIDSMLDERSAPNESLKIDALGIPEIVSGVGVFIIIPALGLSRTFYVDEDTHIFEGNHHQMTLTLNKAFDTDPSQKTATPKKKSGSGSGGGGSTSGKYKVGDVVYFAGGSQYFTQNSTLSSGGKRTAGYAKISRIAEDGKHPYHLIGGKYNDLEGDSNVYGWVDAASFNGSTYQSGSSSGSKNKDTDTYGRKVGDTVYFTGGSQYFSQNSTLSSGGQRTAGYAKINKISEGAQHPYYLVGGKYNDAEGDSNVYGWVDAQKVR